MAKQRLNSGKGKLQKQRTLEKIRYVTDEGNADSAGNEEDLEGDNFSVEGSELYDYSRVVDDAVKSNKISYSFGVSLF